MTSTAIGSANAGDSFPEFATCPAGTTLVGAGGLAPMGSGLVLGASAPHLPSTTRWDVSFETVFTTIGPTTISAYAICASP